MFLTATPAEIGSFISVLAILLGLCVGGFGIYFGFKKRVVQIDPQPIEVRKSAKRFNHEEQQARFVEHDRRLDEHGAEINSLWNTMRAEDAKLREETQTRFLKIAESLGRIEGRLGTNRQSSDS